MEGYSKKMKLLYYVGYYKNKVLVVYKHLLEYNIEL